MTKKPSVEIAMPVYNEAVELEEHIEKLYQFCKNNLQQYAWHITIADNASTDQTPGIGERLSRNYHEIDLIRLTQKGRGRAVKLVWQNSSADICCYMDIDLSTELKHLPELIHAVEKGYAIAIGSRLLPKSQVINRTIQREFISRSLNLIVKLLFQTSFSDVQCGFKAVSRQTVENLIPHIKDTAWFMDTELLIMGEKAGCRIYEVPVMWSDNPGSTVRVLPTVIGDLTGIMRLFFTRPWRNFHE